jgi:cell division protein FtsQ
MSAPVGGLAAGDWHVHGNGEPALEQSAPGSQVWPALAASAGAPRHDRKAVVRSRGLSSRTVVKLSALMAALAGAVAFVALTQGGSHAREARPFLDEVDRLAEQVGLGLRHVYLSGHRMTQDSDIFDALDLVHARSLLRFDTLAARARIERLPWVEAAAVSRVFPDSLSIEITERRPFAVWRRSGREFLIDATGRVLGPSPRGAWAELPRVAGEGAAAAAARVLALLNRHRWLLQRLEEAVLVGERRWTLRLASGAEVLLPADREREALDELMKEPGILRLIETDGVRLDARSLDRLIIRPRTPVAGHAAGRSNDPSG